MFKRETNNHNFRENVVADKKYILRKVDLRFQNPKIIISCKIANYIFLLLNGKVLAQAKVAE